MIVEAFILCWNEEKMIRHTINHYQQFCDKITVIDNKSDDNTLTILSANYPTVGINSFSSNGQIRDDYYQHIKNTCWKKSTADWAIVCDMDELLYHPDILNKLKRIHTNSLPSVTGYNMYSETFPSDYSKPITQQIQYGIREPSFDKQIIFSPKHITEMKFAPGAHRCYPESRTEGIRIDDKSELSLLHYKYIGEQYITEKHAKYAARLSQFNKAHAYGSEYMEGETHIKNFYKTKHNLQKIVNQ
jgi:glycosyltransferase involved in cell wall biosynthesis